MAEPRVRRRIPVAADPPPRVSKPAATSAPSGSLDSLIHERTRLGIVSALAANEKLSFADLKAALNVTDGNISAHTRKLEEAGYIVATKRFEGRVPRTEYQLTAAGREALAKYVEHMEGLIRSLRR